MAQIVSISKARKRLLDLAGKSADLNEALIIVRDSEPVSVLVPYEDYEALLETVDILDAEPDILKKLRQSEKEIAAGQFNVWKPKSRTKGQKTPRGARK